jgi:hypothetical protein
MADLFQQLEASIDEHGLAAVLDNLALVCFAKAEHLQSNWQDAHTAVAWSAAGDLIAGISAKIDL